MNETVITLPAEILDWIAEVAGSPVANASRVPGGASREAWFIDVTDANQPPLFLRYSRERRPAGGLFHNLRTEGEVFLALYATDVTVPRTLAVHPTEEALLAERVAGATWFYRIKDPEEQVRVAQDFIRNLAALHRIPATELDIPGLGPVRTIREHVLEEIENMRRRAGASGDVDPLVAMSLDWLEGNVPDYDGPPVLVQGDTGPGNFMYEDGRVTAVVDWELAHWGDPMDDIAWLSLRTVQDTFTHFPDRLREYEELSGNRIDEQRIWYYRLFAETRLNSNRPSGAPHPVDSSDEITPVAGDVGNPLIYGMLHRRLTVEALAHNVGVTLTPADLPPAAPPEDWHSHYNQMLGSLLTIVPRIDDPLASQWAKGLARLVKFLKEIDRDGRSFRAAELAELAALLGAEPADVHEGRRAVGSALRQGLLSEKEYVEYQWHQVQRDDHLARTASGALRERTWPPLFD